MTRDIYQNNPSKNFSKLINWLIAITMVGAHQFNLQIIPYLLVILIGNKRSSNFLNNKINILILFLISLSILSLSIRGYPFLEAINVSRFFIGLPFLYIFLSPKLLSKLKYPIIISFIAWNLFELIITYVTGEPPFYIKNFLLANDAIDFLLKVGKIEEDTFRLLGPALNSSVNGTIAACILVASIFNKEIIFSNKNISKTQEIFIPIFTAIIFFFSRAGTGYVIILLLLINKFIWPTINNLFNNLRIKIASLTLLSFSLIAIFQAFIIIPSLFDKLELRYISFIFQDKRREILEFLNLSDIRGVFFGIDYNPEALFANGDFIILGFISSLGLVFLISSVFIMMKIFPTNRIYFFALLLSSLHYGTLFTVTGQIICAIVFSSKKKINSYSKYNLLEIKSY